MHARATINGQSFWQMHEISGGDGVRGQMSAEAFTVGDQKQQLARPGQKITWINYGRPNTFTNQPGQFVFAGTTSDDR